MRKGMSAMFLFTTVQEMFTTSKIMNKATNQGFLLQISQSKCRIKKKIAESIIKVYPQDHERWQLA